MSNFKNAPEIPIPKQSNVFISEGNNKLATLFKNGFDALGGIENYVKPGQTVLIKINCVGGNNPTTGGNTDPLMCEALIKMLKEKCQPGRIVVGDETDTIRSDFDAFGQWGWRAMCERQGVELDDMSKDPDYVDVEIDNALYCNTVSVPRIVVDADVYISMAILKNHDTVAITGTIKNNFGLVPELTRRKAHRDIAVEQYLVDILRVRKPDICIVDGRIGMEGIAGGAFFEHPRFANRFIMGDDPVATDTVCAHIMEQNPRVCYLQWANDYGLGTNNLDYINIFGMKLEDAKVHFMSPADEISEFTEGKVHLYDLDSCSQCRAVCQGTFHRFRSENSIQDDVDVVYGPGKWDIPEKRSDKLLLIGDCIRPEYRDLGVWVPGCPMDRENYFKALQSLGIVCNKCEGAVATFVANHTEDELAFLRIVASGKTVYKGKNNDAGELDSVMAVGLCESDYAIRQEGRVRAALEKLDYEGTIEVSDIVRDIIWHNPPQAQLELLFEQLKEGRAKADKILATAKPKERA